MSFGLNVSGRDALPDAASDVKAFPTAEDTETVETTGGRHGSLYRVTSLAANGPGTLVDAVSQPNRIIVFDVSGTINMNSGTSENPS